MTFAFHLILFCTSLGLSLPLWMFCLEVFLSLFPRRQAKINRGGEATLAVLIPAHNEALVLGRTLQMLMPSLPPKTRVVVVADNCTDSTAEIARQHGAEAIERMSDAQRGKGYALQFGLTYLGQDQPAAVVFLDADCQVTPDTVGLLGQAAITTGRPVQGLNLCDPDPTAGPLQAVSALAFRFKNLVRMTGLSRLAGLCYLTGTGMALPWNLIGKARLDGNVVEDMQLGIDLALAGHPTLFLPEACVNSPLPQTQKAASTQRTRWEHGHLSTILSQVPRLLLLALTHRRWNLFCVACDLAIPPLSLLVAVYLVMLMATVTFAATTSHYIPASILLAVSPLFILAIAAGWFVHCRRVIPLGTLLVAPIYILRKLPIYGRFLWKRQLTWVRTERDLAPRA
ncbi:MAG: glycosyltransferase family 2 protein [Planctomycetales bacterium]|nr:glycosyltransferase family 2 protein [Planctomycetales bacterium]